ncbi:uncharacterized protein F5891DRAFT_308583 [Suillus fuscotomentosus]|uniref:Uncharacterized protein n=1 Tax=Suillus fuscotomentosus TaxID=1912939 RepID=A0AAD4E6J3_9AGAM|nr:uncharacterized protein F5891DRAFT_308583 [Suillus fuscotomentosus]KAG1900287.1 hypothetical protein F5891DRAFT_308583 [Suillus fuscotomentosus]
MLTTTSFSCCIPRRHSKPRYNILPPATAELGRLASRVGKCFIVVSAKIKFIDDGYNDHSDRLQLMLELTRALLPGTEVHTCTCPWLLWWRALYCCHTSWSWSGQGCRNNTVATTMCHETFLPIAVFPSIFTTRPFVITFSIPQVATSIKYNTLYNLTAYSPIRPSA